MTKRGDIYMANLNPTKGREQSGIRPVLVFSGDAMNQHSDICIVFPLTTQIKGYPGAYTIGATKTNGLAIDSDVLTFQVRTISQKRLGKKVGRVDKKTLEEIEVVFNQILHY